jgi:hypothetical protein
MKYLINRLQIPVMKLAMTDSQMFNHDEHPARITIDLLTTAGKGINNKEDRLFNDLADVVDNILHKFDADVSAFEIAVNQIKAIIHREKQLAEKIEKQQQQQALYQHARHIVVTQLKMLFYNKKIPEQLKPLVLKNWASLMLNRYIQHGRGSAPWVQSVLLLKLLIKCLQPIRMQSHYNLVKSNHIALMEAVNDELFETRQDKNEIAVQIASLKTHFSQLLKQYDFKLVSETGNDLAAEEVTDDTSDDEDIDQIQQQIDIAKQKIARLSKTTKPGDWYEIYTEKDKAVRRLKLSVILTDAAQLIFVDRKGVKVIEKDAEEFAKELEENRSRIIADHSTFDFALGAVIGRMAA